MADVVARPPFASLLSHRGTCRVLVAAAVAQIGLVAAGLPGWTCPILAGTGVPCPGCGLTHACVALLRGDWHAALPHPVAPAVLVGVALLVAAAVLPAAAHVRLVTAVAAVERPTRVTWILIFVLFASWLSRIV